MCFEDEFIRLTTVYSFQEINNILLLFDSISINAIFEKDENNDIWTILVSKDDYNRAENELKNIKSNYFNKQKSSTYKQKYYAVNKFVFGFVFLSLFIFHFLVHSKITNIQWIYKGKANAYDIVSGNFWEALTSLTLHSSIAHILGNIMFGIIFFWILSKLISQPLMWFFVILSGFCGNLINAFLYQHHHWSIGASTSVFGSLGIIGSLMFYKKFRAKKVRFWIPFGATFALLAFLGTSGKKTDVFAHLFGFLSGLFFGTILGFMLSKNDNINLFYKFVFSVLSLFLIIFSWLKVLNYF